MVTLPVVVAVPRHVVDDGGARVPSEAETGTVEPMVAAESVPCGELLDKGVRFEMVVAAGRGSAEPGLPPIKKTEAKTMSAAEEIDTRLVLSLAVMTEAGTRATALPREQKGRQSLYVDFVCEKIVKTGEGEAGSTQDSMCSVGHAPPKQYFRRKALGTSPLNAVSVRGTSTPKTVFSVRGSSPLIALVAERPAPPHPSRVWCGARTDPN